MRYRGHIIERNYLILEKQPTRLTLPNLEYFLYHIILLSKEGFRCMQKNSGKIGHTGTGSSNFFHLCHFCDHWFWVRTVFILGLLVENQRPNISEKNLRF
jgi:hypothetical protein